MSHASSSAPFAPPAHANGNVEGMEGLPAKFGKYTLIRKLATGGMAELFLAIQKSVAGFEKLLVIKRVLPSMNQDRAFIDMLLAEARIAATLSHPNIVQIFDVGQADGQYFIAMEHVHGEDLRSIVRQMKKKNMVEFPLEHALAIALGMCAGLAYAHEKRDLDGSELNIVHRDISPQNIVVTYTGDVKIVDFGIAKSDSRIGEATRSGKLKGKVPYMSPEQARGQALDGRSDVFAAGVILFELTTGRRLFKGQSEYETLKLICERDYPRPSEIREGYPEDLEDIVMRALAKDRDARYPSARAMQADLEAFVRRHQIVVSSLDVNQFMQGLFEEKLAAQKQALLAGKQLADIIEMQHAAATQSQELAAVRAEEASGQRPAWQTQSLPPAARTVSGVNVTPLRAGKGVVVAVGVAALLLAMVGGGIGYMAVTKSAGHGTATAQEIAPSPKGSLAIESDPPGASIWINGDLRAEVTPATIEKLPLNVAVDVKLTKDGFESAKQEVTIQGEGAPAKLRAELKKGSVVLDVKVLPEGTPVTLTLDGRQEIGPRIDGVTSGESHKLVASAPGYVDSTITFSGAPLETKHVELTLEKTPEPKHLVVAPPMRTTPNPNVTVVSPPPPPPQAGIGKLNVGASGGWCNVTIDGTPRGATPVAGVELSAGPHKVACTTADGKTQTATVTVSADGTARHKFAL